MAELNTNYTPTAQTTSRRGQIRRIKAMVGAGLLRNTLGGFRWNGNHGGGEWYFLNRITKRINKYTEAKYQAYHHRIITARGGRKAMRNYPPQLALEPPTATNISQTTHLFDKFYQTSFRTDGVNIPRDVKRIYRRYKNRMKQYGGRTFQIVLSEGVDFDDGRVMRTTYYPISGYADMKNTQTGLPTGRRGIGINALISSVQYKIFNAIEKYSADEMLEPDTITLRWWQPHDAGFQFIGQGNMGKSEILADKKWLKYNKGTTLNCFYAGVWIIQKLYKEPLSLVVDKEFHTSINNGSKQLKQAFEKHMNRHSKKFLKSAVIESGNYQMIQDFVNWKYRYDLMSKPYKEWLKLDEKHKKIYSCKFEIKLYNNMNRLLRTFRPSGAKPDPKKEKLQSYDIQLLQAEKHYVAMMRWEDLPVKLVERLRTIQEKDRKNKLEEFDNIQDKRVQKALGLIEPKENKSVKITKKGTLFIKPADKVLWKECWEELKENGFVPTKEKKVMTQTCWTMYKAKGGEIAEEERGGFEWKIGAFDIETTPVKNGTTYVSCRGCDGKGNYDNSLVHNGGCYHKAYAIGLTWVEQDFDIDETEEVDYLCEPTYQDNYQEWWGMDCIDDFMAFLNEARPSGAFFHNYTFYAHNGANFDMDIIFRENLMANEDWEINGLNFVELNGGYINIECGSRLADFKITFRDSCKLLPSKLADLTTDFKVEHPKLPDLMEFDEIHLGNYDMPDAHRYLKHDVLGLLEVVCLYSKAVYGATHINITKCYTGASLSKKHYFKNYYDEKTYPLYTLSKKIDRDIRKSYYGGRCEAFQLGRIDEKLYYYDATSLFPYTGTFLLPYHTPTHINGENIKVKEISGGIKNFPVGFFGFLRVSLKSTPLGFTKKPLHAYKCKETGRLIFPHYLEWFDGEGDYWIFSEEVKKGLRLGLYEYRYLEGWNFRPARFLESYFKDAFVRKSEAKAQGKPALTKCWKFVANSGYGWFGLRTSGRDGVILFKPEQRLHDYYMATQKLYSVGQQGKYALARVSKNLEIEDFNVAVASAITSYARMELYSLMYDIEELGGKIYYCDTDSIVANYCMKENLELLKKYNWSEDMPETEHLGVMGKWDLDGKQLGNWKNEADDEVKGYYEKNKALIKQQVDTDDKDGDLFWNTAIICGCKFYALRKIMCKIPEWRDTPFVEILKCKGFKKPKKDSDPKLKWEGFLTLIEGHKLVIEDWVNGNKKQKDLKKQIDHYLITQSQDFFLNPISHHIDEETNFAIQQLRRIKKFCINYTKGQVNWKTLVITPFLWWGGSFKGYTPEEEEADFVE